MGKHEEGGWKQNRPRRVLEPPADGLHQVAAEYQFLRVALQWHQNKKHHHVQPEGNLMRLLVVETDG